MTINRIFLDLDGVLADWASAAIIACDRDPAQVFQRWPPAKYDLADVLSISGNEMWKRVGRCGEKFWAELEPLPWCGELMELCLHWAPTTILTSPSKDPAAAAGKTMWLQAVFGRSFRSYLIGSDKTSCARPGAVLIDDHDGNCDAFRQSGGHSIVFPQRWNSAHELTENRIKHVGDNLLRVSNEAAMAGSCFFKNTGGPCLTNDTVPRSKMCSVCTTALARLAGKA